MTSGQLVMELGAPKRPERLGRTGVSYGPGRVLARASGFIGAYDWVVNPYGGCSFGCGYCYARAFAPTLELREHWGEWVKVRQEAVGQVRAAARSRSEQNRLRRGDAIYMSTVTDPYQPIEQQVGVSASVLQALTEIQPRLTVQTRSPLATRDIPLLRRFERVRVNITITTDSEAVRRRYEPWCPSIRSRFETARRLAEAGVPVGISISPMLPIEDVATFARDVASFGAAEYVTQYFHEAHGRFRGSTSEEAVSQALADGWNVARYGEVRDAIQQALGTTPLLEGSEGFAPPP
jgi:DNA repair photolyase